jgi:hypothetical protein
LFEKIEYLRTQEIDILKKEEKLHRWEKEIERLETKASKESEKQEHTHYEYERLRA